MTITEARAGATDSIDAARGTADDIADETRSRAGKLRAAIEDAAGHVPAVLESARTDGERLAGRLPDAAARTRVGVEVTTTRLQILPDPTLRLLVAASIGLATGLLIAGVPRLFTLAALGPALLAGGAIATRPASVSDGVRR